MDEYIILSKTQIIDLLHEVADEVETARSEGYEAGRAAAEEFGEEASENAYDVGYNDGHAQGYDEGYGEGAGDGYDEGYEDGLHEAGIRAAEAAAYDEPPCFWVEGYGAFK